MTSASPATSATRPAGSTGSGGRLRPGSGATGSASSAASTAAALLSASDSDPVPPAPSLLHPEGDPPSAGANWRSFFGDMGFTALAGTVAHMHGETTPPHSFAAHVKANAISPPDAVPVAPPKRGAAATATPAVPAVTPAQQLQSTAETLWRQEVKWGSMFRAAARFQQQEEEAQLAAQTKAAAAALTAVNLKGTANQMAAAVHAAAVAAAAVVEKDSRRTSFACYAQAHPAQVRRLISRGIPSQYRGFVWQQISGASDMAWRAGMMERQCCIAGLESNAAMAPPTPLSPSSAAVAAAYAAASDPPLRRVPLSSLSPSGAYIRLLSECGPSPHEAQISKDLPRTFPKQVLFRDRIGIGQSALFHVLKAYSHFDPALGYCQGMAFLVAVLLQHLGEEDAFWMLVCLLHSPRYGWLRGLYIPQMPKVCSLMAQLDSALSSHLPKLAAHAEARSAATVISTPWFMTLFAGSAFTNVETVERLWDNLLWQGQWFILKISVAILKIAESLTHTTQHSCVGTRWEIRAGRRAPARAEAHFFSLRVCCCCAAAESLLTLSFDECVVHLKHLHSSLSSDHLVEQALLVNLDYTELQRVEDEFERARFAQNKEAMKEEQEAALRAQIKEFKDEPADDGEADTAETGQANDQQDDGEEDGDDAEEQRA